MKIIKRDGKIEEFIPYKIEEAVKKAFASESVEYNSNVFKNVLTAIDSKEMVSVEEIQDLIEKELRSLDYFNVMKSFMNYRLLHKMKREHILGLNEDTTYINATQTIEEYIGKSDWRIQANSNTGYSNAGLINNTAGKVIANYWLDKVYSKEEGLAHRNGDYHIHDLDCLTAYCFTGDTRIRLIDGSTPSFEELCKTHKNSDIWVLSVDQNGDYQVGRGHSPRVTRKNSSLVAVTLDNNEVIRCTPDHKFLLKNNTYKEAKDLVVSESLMVAANTKEISVSKVELLDYTEDVYDITVENYHNFALESGVIVHNCAGWSLRALLDEGFNGVRGRVEARAPSHFKEALGQMANFLGILQAEWAGAQAFSSFDTYLAPYVFKDQLSEKEVKKAIVSFIYNLNVPARWGQSPFTNITIDWTVPSDLKDQIPTKQQQHLFKGIKSEELLKIAQERNPEIKSLEEMTYKYFQKEMNMINKAYYEVMTEGDKTGQPFTFPIPTVNITEDFDWYGENTDILFENTAKIGSSYFQNFIGSQYVRNEEGKLVENPEAYRPGHVRSMCCRLQLDLRELLKRGGGLFGSAEMTGCYTADTEILTESGWIHFKDLIGNEKVLTMNNNKVPSWEVIEEKHKYFVNDKIYVFNKNGIPELSVTPNHRMIVNKENSFEIKRADKIFKDSDIYTISKSIPMLGNFPEISIDNRIVDLKLFYKLIGILMQDNEIIVSDNKIILGAEISRNYYLTIENLLNGLYIVHDLDEDTEQYVIFEKDFIDYYLNINNNIPKELFSADSEIINAFYEGMKMSKYYLLNKAFYAITENFKNDLQYLLVLLGKTTKTVLSIELEESLDFYKITENNDFIFYKEDLEIKHYEGFVYCVTVPNNTVCVRHNGAINWSGNSLGVVTINMARLGYLYKEEEKLIKELDRLMDLSKSTLEKKRVFIQEMYDRGLYPYTARYLHGFNNHFSTIGVNGINEMIRNFSNDSYNITDKEGKEFAIKILNHIRNKMVQYQEETGNLYNLEATPAEGTTYRFAKEDKKRYPDIIQAGFGENFYYTNSSQVPANFTDDPFEALELQDDLQCKYTGGCCEKGTKVITNKGTFNIEDIVEDFKINKDYKVIGYDKETGKSNWYDITEAMSIDVSKHDKIKITAEKGFNITTSDWHPFFVLTENGVIEKRADELNVGDKLIQNNTNFLTNEEGEDINKFYSLGLRIGKEDILKLSEIKNIEQNRNYKNIIALIAGLIGFKEIKNNGLQIKMSDNEFANKLITAFTLAGFGCGYIDSMLFIPLHELTRKSKDLNEIMTVSKIQARNIQIPEKIEYVSFIRVKSVDKVNVSDEQFYDFTVDKVHNYLAGKQSFVYVHNTVLHLYMRERLSSAEACRKLVKNVISNHRLPYITVTPVFSVCEKHGYLAGEHEYCPKCDEELLLQNKNLTTE